MRILFLSILSLLLVGCLKGRVTTISDASPPQQPVFTVISKDSVSLRARHQ